MIEVVPAPEFTVVPEGTDQLYDVAPATALIVYVAVCPGHTVTGPVIAPGAVGVDAE